MIIEIFGKEIAKHVEGLTRIKPHGKISIEESLNLLIKQKRYDTAFIKLFDRIHNVQTLAAKSPEKAKKIIEETLRNFVPLSIYLKIKIPTILLDIQIDIQKKFLLGLRILIHFFLQSLKVIYTPNISNPCRNNNRY